MFRYSRPAALTAAAILTAGLAVPAITATAAPTDAAECVKAGLVWVHVEFDDTVLGACAEEFGTAEEALLDTGFLTEPTSYITTLAGRTSDEAAREWWSIYTLSPVEDAYTDDWSFAEVGAQELELGASDVLAMVLQPDWTIWAEPPAVNPVEGVTLGEEPTPSPSPEPTASPTPSASPSPTATPTPSPSTPTRPGLPHTGA